MYHRAYLANPFQIGRHLCTKAFRHPEQIQCGDRHYRSDRHCNIPSSVLKLLERRLLFERDNPLHLLKCRLAEHFHRWYRKSASGSPLFTVVDRLDPVVTVWENFDSLLTPKDHVSRRSSDSYYVNEQCLLRAHSSAHQHGLFAQGLDNFLVFADVYRRDKIDATHFPCFHQMEAVRLFSHDQLFDTPSSDLGLVFFEEGRRDSEKQETHTRDCAKVLELSLKNTIERLVVELFGNDVQMRWNDDFFPFTHPSFELEVFCDGKWLELLGCGVLEQKLLRSAGVGGKVGWAFGIGLERLAMKLYGIPDIRLFWTRDSGFLSQFAGKNPSDSIVYKISKQPQVIFDLSFWLPSEFSSMCSDLNTANINDLIRSIGGDLIEQAFLVDSFQDSKTGLKSQCYRIVYRSATRVLTKAEANELHSSIEQMLVKEFNVTIR